MATKRSQTDDAFYKTVVRVTHAYLGPAADRFVARQVRYHLGKEPEQLQKHELAGLIDWLGMSLALLSEDEQLIRDYIAELHSLAANGNHKPKAKPALS